MPAQICGVTEKDVKCGDQIRKIINDVYYFKLVLVRYYALEIDPSIILSCINVINPI